jgi:hypothetical protein
MILAASQLAASLSLHALHNKRQMLLMLYILVAYMA